MMQTWTRGRGPQQERNIPMHDLFIALAFIGMVIAPAIVAAQSDVEPAEEAE